MLNSFLSFKPLWNDSDKKLAEKILGMVVAEQIQVELEALTSQIIAGLPADADDSDISRVLMANDRYAELACRHVEALSGNPWWLFTTEAKQE